MKTKIITLFLVLVASIGTIFASDTQVDGIWYKFNSTNLTAEVTSSSDKRYTGDITIPSSVTYRGKTYSVTSIGYGSFYYCYNLTSVTIPNSVTSIGWNAFDGCTGLNEVHISDIAAWCAISFESSRANPLYYAHNLYLNDELITDLVIPNSVTIIGGGAFEGCTSMTSVTIPNSVTRIGSDAFSDCSGLNEVHISDIAAWCAISFESSRANPLYYAHNLYLNDELITDLVIPNSVTSIGMYAFYDCSSLTSVTIPNSVTSIGDAAFAGCSGLTSVNIPNSVTSIDTGAFEGCTGLTSIEIPNSVTIIGCAAFVGCTGLTSIEIPNSVTIIGCVAFEGCTGLTSIEIPNSVTDIGSDAFYGCTGLASITCYATTPPTLGINTWDYSNIILYVPAGSINAYKSADQWNEFATILPISAKETKTTGVNTASTANSVNVTWPAVEDAATYELVIKDKEGNIICRLIFNAQGQLISITYNAPSRDGAPQQTQTAGFSFTITGLDAGTEYDLTITAKNENGQEIDKKNISFHTDGVQGFEDINTNIKSTKLLHNGQILIFRGDKTYTLTGQEVK